MRIIQFERSNNYEWTRFIGGDPDSIAGVPGLAGGRDPGAGWLEETSVRLPGGADRLRDPGPAGIVHPDYHGAARRELEPGWNCLPGGIDPGGRLGAGAGGDLWVEEMRGERNSEGKGF